MNKFDDVIKSFGELKGLESLEMYIYGSFLNTLEPNDMDLVIIYDKEQLSKEAVKKLKVEINKIVMKSFHVKPDIIFMSKKEAYEENLISHFPLLRKI